MYMYLIAQLGGGDNLCSSTHEAFVQFPVYFVNNWIYPFESLYKDKHCDSSRKDQQHALILLDFEKLPSINYRLFFLLSKSYCSFTPDIRHPFGYIYIYVCERGRERTRKKIDAQISFPFFFFFVLSQKGHLTCIYLLPDLQCENEVMNKLATTSAQWEY